MIPQDTEEPEEELLHLVQMVQTLGCYISVNLTSKESGPGQLWCDTGCTRGLGGEKQHAEWARVYRQLNMCAVADGRIDTFQFGNGKTDKAKLTKLDPVFIRGIYIGSINQAVVTSICPMLLSKAVLPGWDADLRMGRNDITLNKFQVAIPFTDDKVPVIDILDRGTQSLKHEWSKMPWQYKLTENGPWAAPAPDVSEEA